LYFFAQVQIVFVSKYRDPHYLSCLQNQDLRVRFILKKYRSVIKKLHQHKVSTMMRDFDIIIIALIFQSNTGY